MLRKIKDLIKSILRPFPSVQRYLTRQLHQRKRWKTELELIKGTHKTKNTHSSIIHFSFNKAATQYVKSILVRCAVEEGMVPVSFPDYAFNSDFPYLDKLSAEEMKKYNHIFKKRGYLYSVFGGMVEGIQDLDQYKVVLVTRDPRDILVSEYYSIVYSHTIPNKEGNKYDDFVSRKKAAREVTIDEYVISESRKVFEVFSRYQTLPIDQHKNIYVTTYEQMVSDFPTWLTNLINYCDLNISKGSIKSLLKENEEKKPKKENIHKHIRKGQPGDYKEKLLPETIMYLNQKFDSILKQYHYT